MYANGLSGDQASFFPVILFRKGAPTMRTNGPAFRPVLAEWPGCVTSNSADDEGHSVFGIHHMNTSDRRRNWHS